MTWVHDPALGRIWTVLRARLEERGLRAGGRVVLTGLDRAERHAAAALVGRPITAARCTVDLAACDAALAERSGIGGLHAVLEAVAERHGGRHPVVCTSGRPVLVVLDVLRALSGATLRYHGDFDWPGVAITNRLVTDAGVRPWRMSAGDYTAAGGPGLPLTGDPIEPSWDADLGAAMRHHGLAVHEEAVLGDLLAALG